MNISSKSNERSRQTTKLVHLTQPLRRFINWNDTDGRNRGRQSPSRLEPLAAVLPTLETEVSR